MAENETERGSADALGALVGSPVDVSRRHRGKLQDDYLGEEPGEGTLIAMTEAGLAPPGLRQKRRLILLLVALVVGAGAVSWLVC